MSQVIRDALLKLDPANDNHWTAEGLPKLETLKFLAGGVFFDRASVTAAAPQFTRGNPSLPAAVPPEPAQAPAGATETPAEGAGTAQAPSDAQAASNAVQGAEGGSEQDSAGEPAGTDTEAEPSTEGGESDPLAALQAAVERTRGELAAAQTAHRAACEALDRAAEALLKTHNPRAAAAETVKAYHASQRELLAARAAQAAARPRAVPVSPLDRAFTRNKARPRPTRL